MRCRWSSTTAGMMQPDGIVFAMRSKMIRFDKVQKRPEALRDAP